jgi:hypothetical protein
MSAGVAPIDDDGETPLGPNPDASDLPPLRPYRGPRQRYRDTP